MGWSDTCSPGSQLSKSKSLVHTAHTVFKSLVLCLCQYLDSSEQARPVFTSAGGPGESVTGLFLIYDAWGFPCL